MAQAVRLKVNEIRDFVWFSGVASIRERDEHFDFVDTRWPRLSKGGADSGLVEFMVSAAPPCCF